MTAFELPDQEKVWDYFELQLDQVVIKERERALNIYQTLLLSGIPVSAAELQIALDYKEDQDDK